MESLPWAPSPRPEFSNMLPQPRSQPASGTQTSLKRGLSVWNADNGEGAWGFDVQIANWLCTLQAPVAWSPLSPLTSAVGHKPLLCVLWPHWPPLVPCRQTRCPCYKLSCLPCSFLLTSLAPTRLYAHPCILRDWPVAVLLALCRCPVNIW